MEAFASPTEEEFALTGHAEVPHPLRMTSGRNEVPASVEGKKVDRVRRGSPVLRPRTSRMREPQTLIPRRVSAATRRLKTLRVNQFGAT